MNLATTNSAAVLLLRRAQAALAAGAAAPEVRSSSCGIRTVLLQIPESGGERSDGLLARVGTTRRRGREKLSGGGP